MEILTGESTGRWLCVWTIILYSIMVLIICVIFYQFWCKYIYNVNTLGTFVILPLFSNSNMIHLLNFNFLYVIHFFYFSKFRNGPQSRNIFTLLFFLFTAIVVNSDLILCMKISMISILKLLQNKFDNFILLLFQVLCRP